MQLRGQLLVSATLPLYPSDRILCGCRTLSSHYREEKMFHPNHCKVLHYQLIGTSKDLEQWQNAATKIKSWTFLNKECEQIRPPPSQTGWLITIVAVQHVWRRVNVEEKFKYVETRNLNQDVLQNSFGAIRLNCGSNNNPSVGQCRCPEYFHQQWPCS
jgi:hypothetical protein